MTKDKFIPESFDEVKKQIFKKVWLLLKKQSLVIKIVLILISLAIVFFLARMKVLGQPFYRFSRILIPFHLAGVDKVNPFIPLTLSFEVHRSTGIQEQGKIGGHYKTGDNLTLYFQTGVPSWATIFCIDSQGVYNILQHGYPRPESFVGNQLYTFEVELDTTVGVDVIYTIASHNNFDFEKDVRPYLTEVFINENTKGVARFKFHLDLPDGLSHKYIYYNHLTQE